MMASSIHMNLFSTLTFLVLIANVLNSNSSPVPTSPEIGSCPAKIKPGDKKLLYHNQTQKCYKEKSKGPCPGNMVMYPLDKVFGDCDCPDRGYLPWVYHPKTDDCYKTYQQAYCPAGQWLIFDESEQPICKPNPCLERLSDDEDSPTVLYKDKCVTYGTASELCPNPSGDFIKILPGEVFPKCVSDVSEHTISKTNRLKCRPGTRRDINGACRRTVTMDDSSLPKSNNHQ